MSRYEAACHAARVEPLGGDAGGAGPEERARPWRGHAQRSILAAFRERRAQALG